VEIKVIGNDAGEKLSILSGFISRVDRNAPKYRGWRDFNTCYYQANAAATGGSSGSPVVNSDGYAIALQAGGRTGKASTDYFLPLDAPLRALRKLREGSPITRGDIQCAFALKTFEECRRLGLTPAWETKIRAAHPKLNNMMVAETVVPEGPSYDKIKDGDIILQINDDTASDLFHLERVLDESIGKKIPLTLWRGNSEIEEHIMVDDVRHITPDRLLSFAGAAFQNLSYELAQRWKVARRGVYMCESGNWVMKWRAGYLIKSVDHTETPDLDAFVSVVKSIPDKARVTLRYRELWDIHTIHTAVVSLDRQWSSKMKMITRDDSAGEWIFEILAEAPPPAPPKPCKASFPRQMLRPAAADVVRSFVTITWTAPLGIEGAPSRRKTGMGLVLDAKRGIALVSRTIVPHSFCSIEIKIADSILVDGKVIFLHPTQNYCLVQYDPALVDAPVQSAVLDSAQIAQGDSVLFVGVSTKEKRIIYTSAIVSRVSPMEIEPHSPPKYRPINNDWVGVDTVLGVECESGVLVAEDGKVQAVWMTCAKDSSTTRHYGLATPPLKSVIARVQNESLPRLRLLPAEFETVTIFKARALGVSEEWIEKVHATESHHQLFAVKRVFGGTPGQLKEGDVLLTLGGNLVTTVADLDVMYWHGTLDAVVIRDGEPIPVQVDTIPAEVLETTHVVTMAGLVLTKPHNAVRQQTKKLPNAVYIASRRYGSPAFVFSLHESNFITHINDMPTTSLEDLLEISHQIPNNTCKY
jgi:S1-C subfamily serine protease